MSGDREAEARAEGIADCRAVVEGMLKEAEERWGNAARATAHRTRYRHDAAVLSRALEAIESMRRETRAPGPTLDEKRAE